MIKKLSLYFISFVIIINIYSQNWQQVGSQECLVKHLFADSVHNKLIGSGNFVASNGVDTIWYIAQWNGSYWDSLASGITPLSYGAESFALFNGELIVGGGFIEAGGIPAKGIAKWDGNSWDSIGTGTDATIIWDMLVSNDTLFGIGCISGDGGTTYTSVASFGGVSWESIGSPPPIGSACCMLKALELYNNQLYIGGTIENDSSANILKWDGNNWRTVGLGVPDGYFEDAIKDFQVYHDRLYIGGAMQGGFDNFPYDYFGIANWDGMDYTLPGGGILDGRIFDMVVYNDTLYAVGEFNHAGGVLANCIAKWDGTNWCSLGSTFNGPIRSVEVFNNELYIGGFFTQIDGLPIKGVAKWIGGSFTENCGNTTGIEDEMNLVVEIYPNPASNSLTISVPEVPVLMNSSYSISNLLGQKLFTRSLILYKELIDISSLSDGIYIIEIISGGKKLSKKFLKLN